VPCDVRCTRSLACGHQCPSLCGEKCPSSEYCVDCAAAGAPSTAKTRDQVVDMVMHSTLAEVDFSDPETTPILVLGCGHAFNSETLDGIFQLERFYVKAGKQWVRANSLDEVETNDDDAQDPLQRVPSCPTCRQPVSGVRRYSRLLNYATINAVQRKWLLASQQRASTMCGEIGRCEETLTSKPPAKFNLKACKEADRLGRSAAQFYDDNTKRSPTHDVCEKELGALSREAMSAKQAFDRNAALLLCRRNGVAPLAVPRLLAYDVALRSLQLQIVSACLNFDNKKLRKALDAQQKKKDKSKKDKKSAKPAPAPPQLDDDNDDNDAVDFEVRRGLKQLSLVERFLVLAQSRYERLIAECEKEQMQTRRNDAHALYARLLLVANDSAAAIDVSAAACSAHQARRTVRELRQACIDEAARLLDAGLIDATLFGEAIARACASLADVRYTPMSDDEKRMVFQAMARDVGSGHGSYGGHWFKCPNGHPYAIGECGGAMQQSSCPECGAVVGGGSHQLAAGNAVADDFAKYQD
jgi:hypothetical protein